MTECLTDLEDIVIKASSTLKRDTAEYGPRNALNDEPDSCWSSDQGLPQYLDFNFKHYVNVTTVSLTFQGGFVGSEIKFYGTSSSKRSDLTYYDTRYAEDSNDEQTFDININGIQRLRIEFTSSSDFYGRVIVYHVRIFGEMTELEG
eukprot:gb/GECG01005860.1/.p1 GENE.gb/GECG01005860.1/~~gb/GECG01005860.1/.p1  ORF type:complete len:147 (+),score=17.65 gb/GECG01005860.1/:1-441(+)